MSARAWLSRRNRRDSKKSSRKYALALKRSYVPPEPFADVMWISVTTP